MQFRLRNQEIMKNQSNRSGVGIDDMVAYIPKLFLPIEDLAKARNIEFAK